MKRKKILSASFCLLLSLPLIASCDVRNASDSEVKVNQVRSISITGQPKKVYYRMDEDFDPTGLDFKLNLRNGTSVDMQSFDFSFSKVDFSDESKPQVTVTYDGDYGQGETIFNNGLIYDKVLKLDIVNPPLKNTYAPGEEFDSSGINVLATWSDGYRTSVDYHEISYEPKIIQNDTKDITIKYKGGEAKLPINKTAITKIEYSIPSNYNGLYYLGNTLDLKGINVKLTFQDGSSRNAKESELSYKMDGNNFDSSTPLENVGKHNLSIYFANRLVNKSAIPVEVKDAYLIEAENYYSSSSAPTGSGSYVVKGDSSQYRSYSDSDTASGGKYVGGINTNDTMDFHFNSKEARKASVAISLANTNIDKNSSGQYPVRSIETNLNKLIKVKINGNDYPIGDDVKLKGEESINGKDVVDGSLWFRWQQISFGNMETQVGDNVIEVQFVVDFNRPGDNYIAAPNVDYMKVNFENNGQIMEDKVQSVTLTPNIDLKNLKISDALGSKTFTSFIVYESGIKNPSPLENFKFTIDGTEWKVGETLENFSSGNHILKAVLREDETKEFNFDIVIKNEQLFEAEDFFTSKDQVPQGVTNYALKIKGTARKATDAPKGDDKYRASGDAYLGYIADGDEMEYHFQTKKEQKGKLTIRLTNSYVVKGNNGNPSQIDSIPLSDVIDISFNGTRLSTIDNIKLDAWSDPNGSFNGWFVWSLVDLGELLTKAGEDNVLKITFKGQIKRPYDNNPAAPNLDYIKIAY